MHVILERLGCRRISLARFLRTSHFDFKPRHNIPDNHSSTLRCNHCHSSIIPTSSDTGLRYAPRTLIPPRSSATHLRISSRGDGRCRGPRFVTTCGILTSHFIINDSSTLTTYNFQDGRYRRRFQQHRLAGSGAS